MRKFAVPHLRTSSTLTYCSVSSATSIRSRGGRVSRSAMEGATRAPVMLRSGPGSRGRLSSFFHTLVMPFHAPANCQRGCSFLSSKKVRTL